MDICSVCDACDCPVRYIENPCSISNNDQMGMKIDVLKIALEDIAVDVTNNEKTFSSSRCPKVSRPRHKFEHL